jgi:hypothetical protein
MLIVITQREHATILTSLWSVSQQGRLGNIMEIEIATNGGGRNVMITDEIDRLGDYIGAETSDALLGGETS